MRFHIPLYVVLSLIMLSLLWFRTQDSWSVMKLYHSFGQIRYRSLSELVTFHIFKRSWL